MSKEMRIPEAKIKEGIAISLRTAKMHLDSAELLIRNDFSGNAVVLLEFAIEEFGRAVYLRERLHNGLETIESALQTNHSLKYDKAFSVLPKDLKTIWENTIGWFPKGWFPANYFPRGYWPILKETISPDTRLDATFTDYDEKTQTWQSGIKTDGKRLMTIVNIIGEHIRFFSY